MGGVGGGGAREARARAPRLPVRRRGDRGHHARANLEAFGAGGSSRACCATSGSATSPRRSAERRCRRPCCWGPSACSRSFTPRASWPSRARGGVAGLARRRQHGRSSHTLEQIAEAGGGRAALVSSSTGPRRGAGGQLRQPRRGGRLRGAGRHPRHVAARLAPARPQRRLSAVPAERRDRQLPRRPRVPLHARAHARGGPAGRRRPVRRRLSQPDRHVGRPVLAARPDLAADPAQGHPPPRRRPRGRRSGHRRGDRLQPRRAPGRRRAGRPRRAAGGGRRGGRRPRRPHRQRHPRRRRRVQGAGPRRARRARRPAAMWGLAVAARTACETILRSSWPSST